MAVINKKYDRKARETSFCIEKSGRPIASLSVKLSEDDFNMVLSVIDFAYGRGVEEGSESRAAEIRTALGLEK